jgi:hypothetical protein
MDVSNFHQNILRLESIIASNLQVLLEKNPIGLTLHVEPSADILSSLEYYIPLLLSRYYSKWEHESLDGILLANAQKVDSKTVEFVGVCILMSDQTVQPIFIRLTLGALCDSISSYQVRLGESGVGRLRIPYGSSKAQELLMTINTRLKSMKWSYIVGRER